MEGVVAKVVCLEHLVLQVLHVLVEVLAATDLDLGTVSDQLG